MDYFLAFGKKLNFKYDDLQYSKSVLTTERGLIINKMYLENSLKVSDSVSVLHHVDLQLIKTFIN